MADILHSDCNNFYASVECLKHPEYKDKPLVVCGSEKDRHGVVLSKNYIAKEHGIYTGQTVAEARTICSNLISVTADFETYLQFSKRVKAIYMEYSNYIESFGIDEAWIDVTHSKIFGSAEEIAEKIKERVKKEIGITVSIGVSYNKIFAKLGSDYKKPDAITVINKSNYKDIVWPLPVKELLYVGKATEKKLHRLNIFTIGELANYDVNILHRKLGKWGVVLNKYARGDDTSPVKKLNDKTPIKSVGNSFTFERDLENESDVRALVSVLAESVANRMFSYNIYKARTLQIYLRDTALRTITRQAKFNLPTALSRDFVDLAMQLWKNEGSPVPLRSLGISVCDFVERFEQLNLFANEKDYNKHFIIDRTVKTVRDKFKFTSLARGSVLIERKLAIINPQEEHTIHPVVFS